jgi:hypothetical protein
MQVLGTLKNNHLLANLKKNEFSQHSLVYLGYVINGGDFNIDFVKMEQTIKWLVPTNVTKFTIFVGTPQYIWNLIASISLVFSPLHTITTSNKSF